MGPPARPPKRHRPRPVKPSAPLDRKSTRLNSSHTVIYTLSLHDALPILVEAAEAMEAEAGENGAAGEAAQEAQATAGQAVGPIRSEEHTSELQSHSDLHSFPTRRSSDLGRGGGSDGS